MVETTRGVIFDMDGTLTEPTIDFAAMRRDLGCERGDILAWLEALSGAERERAERVIHEHEAGAPLTLRTGCVELLDALDALEIPMAIVTRNSRHGIERLLEVTGPRFDVLIDRTFDPPKPDPAALLHIAARWELEPDHVVMIGDSIHDMLAARNARMRALLTGLEPTERARRTAHAHAPELGDVMALLATR